jgi:hypothetical protein
MRLCRVFLTEGKKKKAQDGFDSSSSALTSAKTPLSRWAVRDGLPAVCPVRGTGAGRE